LEAKEAFFIVVMYIRWKTHKHCKSNEVSYYAYLVQSQRNEDGQPRQTVAAYLGKPERGWQYDAIPLVEWWLEVNKTLAAFDFDDDERERLEDALAERYNKPTEGQGYEYRASLAFSALDKEELRAWRRGKLEWP
jgi:hypothetical protein